MSLLRISAFWTDSNSCATYLTAVPPGQLVLPKHFYKQFQISSFLTWWDFFFSFFLVHVSREGSSSILNVSSVHLCYCSLFHTVYAAQYFIRSFLSFLLFWQLCAGDLCLRGEVFKVSLRCFVSNFIFIEKWKKKTCAQLFHFSYKCSWD